MHFTQSLWDNMFEIWEPDITRYDWLISWNRLQHFVIFISLWKYLIYTNQSSFLLCCSSSIPAASVRCEIPPHAFHLCTPFYWATALHCTALHCTALHCNKLNHVALNCSELHCSALHCTQTSKCLNHHNQRLCKIFFAGVNWLLWTYSVLLQFFVAF